MAGNLKGCGNGDEPFFLVKGPLGILGVFGAVVIPGWRFEGRSDCGETIPVGENEDIKGEGCVDDR